MLVCATAAKAKDGGKEEQMTQVSISSAFDSPQVLQECLSYLRQTAQDQVADNNHQAHQIRQCRATTSSASVHESKAEGGMLRCRASQRRPQWLSRALWHIPRCRMSGMHSPKHGAKYNDNRSCSCRLQL